MAPATPPGFGRGRYRGGMVDEPTSDDPAARLARLDSEIQEARRRLGALRHEGERHFIDDQPVHAEVPDLLKEVIERYERLRGLHGGSTSERHLNPPLSAADAAQVDTGLAELEARIGRLRQLAATDPHRAQRHFID